MKIKDFSEFNKVYEASLRRLPIDQKYEILDISYCGLDNAVGYSCENCGKSIANYATIKGSKDDKTYIIGLDCYSNVIAHNNLSSNKFQDSRKIQLFNIFKSDLAAIKAGLKKHNPTHFTIYENKDSYKIIFLVKRATDNPRGFNFPEVFSKTFDKHTITEESILKMFPNLEYVEYDDMYVSSVEYDKFCKDSNLKNNEELKNRNNNRAPEESKNALNTHLRLLLRDRGFGFYRIKQENGLFAVTMFHDSFNHGEKIKRQGSVYYFDDRFITQKELESELNTKFEKF